MLRGRLDVGKVVVRGYSLRGRGSCVRDLVCSIEVSKWEVAGSEPGVTSVTSHKWTITSMAYVAYVAYGPRARRPKSGDNMRSCLFVRCMYV